MEKKILPETPIEITWPGKQPEIERPLDPEEPLVTPPELEPELVPDEDPFETPPYEIPSPAEGP